MTTSGLESMTTWLLFVFSVVVVPMRFARKR